MSYDAAKEVQASLTEMLRHDKSVVMIGIETSGPKFGVLVGSTHPQDVDVPKHLDNVPIRVIYQDPPSPFEPRD